MRRSAAALLAVALAAALSACMPEPIAYDLTPPAVVGTRPGEGDVNVPLTVQPEIGFSEALDAATVTPAHFVVVAAELVDEAFLTDLDSGGIGTSRLDDTVPVVPSLVGDGSTVVLAPQTSLAPGVTYALLVSAAVQDTFRNPLDAHTMVTFTTEGPGAAATVETPQPGATAVPLNLEAIRVSFSAPVNGVDGGTFRLEDAAGQPIAGTVSVAEDRRSASRDIGVQLQPSSVYTVVLTEDIADDGGRSIQPQRASFTTAACADLVAPTLSGEAASPRDVTVTVTWTTDEPSDSRVTVEAVGVCASAPAEAEGGQATCAAAYDPCNPQPASCTHRVVVAGLCPETAFRLTPRSADAIGNGGTGITLDVTTTAPQAKPVISEVLADATTPEENGEFIEVVNDSDIAWDVTGWKIAKVTATTVERVLVRQDGTTDPVPPRGVAVYAVRAFEAGRYGGLPAGTVWLVAEGDPGETKVFGNGLANDGPPRLELRDPSGNAVSVWPADADCAEGRSAERFDLAGPDDLTNVGCTVAPTPGVAP